MALADNIGNEVQASIDLAQSSAQSALGATLSLVQNAVGVLTQYHPDFPADPVTIASVGIDVGGSFDATEKPPSFPSIRTPQQIALGALGDIPTIDDQFTATAPTLDLPIFNYTTPAALTPFSGTAPTIDSSITVPDTPTISYPALPTLLALNTDITLPDLVIPPATFTLPTYNNVLSTTFVAEIANGRAAVPNPDDYSMQVVNRFFPGLSDTYSRLIARVNGNLDGSVTALTDAFDTHLYESLKTRVITESSAAEQALTDASLASGWELPGAVRAAGLNRIRYDLATTLGATAMEVYTKRAERELQQLQFVMGLAKELQGSALQLFVNAFTMQMEAFRGVLQYADAATKFALAVYEIKQRDFELLCLLVDKQIAIFEALLRAELAKTEVTKAKLEVERLKSEQNHALIAQYTAQLQGEETKVRLYTGQIDALGKLLEARKLPLDAFLANIQGYTATVDAKKAEYALLQAQIEGDKAKTEGQIAKLEVYKTQASVFGTVVAAKTQEVQGQIQRNQQILEEFRTRLNAEVSYSQIDEAVAKHALDVYDSMARVFVMESQQKLASAQFEFNKTLEDAKLELEQTRFAYEKQFKNMELEMTRIKATADVNMAGAATQGHVAAAALSSLNNVLQLGVSVSG